MFRWVAGRGVWGEFLLQLKHEREGISLLRGKGKNRPSSTGKHFKVSEGRKVTDQSGDLQEVSDAGARGGVILT